MIPPAVVLEAFLRVRQGKSAEQVVCDDTLDQAFIASCRNSNHNAPEDECNRTLLNLRKAGKLAGFPTIRRKPRLSDAKGLAGCVGQTVRLMERQFTVNVDTILCNPDWRCQFDAMVQFLLPGASVFESRYKALTLRKTKKLRPEPVGQIIRPTASSVIPLDTLGTRIHEIPVDTGVYIFFDEHTTLYVGKADNLRRRVTDHVSAWAFRELISAINRGDRGKAWVAFHALPVSLSSRDVAAYEQELIRSRQPEHNRAGKNL